RFVARLYSFTSPFFFNDPATTEIFTLSLHDALPIFHRHCRGAVARADAPGAHAAARAAGVHAPEHRADGGGTGLWLRRRGGFRPRAAAGRGGAGRDPAAADRRGAGADRSLRHAAAGRTLRR